MASTAYCHPFPLSKKKDNNKHQDPQKDPPRPYLGLGGKKSLVRGKALTFGGS